MDLRRRIERLEQHAATRDKTPAFRALTDDEVASHVAAGWSVFPRYKPPGVAEPDGVALLFPPGAVPSMPRPADGPVGRADQPDEGQVG
jgi:hypothetical protein